MKRTKRQSERLAERRQRKAARMYRAGKASKYASKVARKCGSGKVDPNWQWWLERPEDRLAGRVS